jgi:hypothetical protein
MREHVHQDAHLIPEAEWSLPGNRSMSPFERGLRVWATSVGFERGLRAWAASVGCESGLYFSHKLIRTQTDHIPRSHPTLTSHAHIPLMMMMSFIVLSETKSIRINSGLVFLT